MFVALTIDYGQFTGARAPSRWSCAGGSWLANRLGSGRYVNMGRPTRVRFGELHEASFRKIVHIDHDEKDIKGVRCGSARHQMGLQTRLERRGSS